MPGRKKPISAKQKKATLQDKRALKRGETPASHLGPDGQALPQPGRNKSKSTTQQGVKSHLRQSEPDSNAATKVKALQSRFLKLSPIYLARTQAIAFNQPLPRPIPVSAAIFSSLVDKESDATKRDEIRRLMKRLTCPRRPKWKYGMTKKEVERNEEGLFVKWMEEMQGVMSDYLSLDDEEGAQPTGNPTPTIPGAPKISTRQAMRNISTERSELDKPLRSPSYFEQNLEVWRQLWRVTEQSNILLVLMDIRCPPVHFPASLRAYLRDAAGIRRDTTPGRSEAPQPGSAWKGKKKIVLVLTKVDLVSPACVEGWKKWCKDWWRWGEDEHVEEEGEVVEEIDVIAVESYKREALRPAAGEHNRRIRHIPYIPPHSLRPLIDAIRRAYSSLLDPPDTIKNDETKLAAWTEELESRLKRDVDWDAFEKMLSGEKVVETEDLHVRKGKLVKEKGARDHQEPVETEEGTETYVDTPRKLDFLTLGLIGQPNVGKSSLLNALLGESKVTASKTPGKTKHFQSIFWSRDVRIVDCPGLVLPSFAGVETQVMSGILPISQIPSLPACIHHAARLMPLEKILRLPDPQRWEEDRIFWAGVEGKKTRREPENEEAVKVEAEKRGPKWMAGDIMTGWAEERGYLTAKAGRPDTNRAGNAIMRMIAEGRIPYRYFAPSTDLSEVEADIQEVGNGIWCPPAVGHDPIALRADIVDSEEEEEAKADDGSGSGLDDLEEGDEDEEEEEEEDNDDEDESEDERPVLNAGATSRFAALMMDEGADDTDSDSEEDE